MCNKTIQAFFIGENMNIKKIINYRKVISILTATCLLVSFVVGPTAANAINNEQTIKEYNKIFKEFILPYNYGKITKSHFAGTDRVIINIQDLHCHPKVQKNIANIIESFDKKFGVNKIYLEGAYGDVNTSWINDKSLLGKMLDTGRLTGAEYYSALSGKNELIKGLEEKQPYLDNIKRLGKILQNQGKIELILQSLKESNQQLKKKYYTKRQYKLENLFEQYKEGKLTSQKYYAELSKHIDKLGIDLTEYENTLTYITLLELQKDLKYNQIAKELQSFILSLKKQVPYTVYKSLLENTENFKEIEKFYSYIIQLNESLRFNISANFKELDKYFRCMELNKKINPIELVKEDEFLIQEINTRFAQTKAQQEIVFLIYFEKYLTDYITTKITLDNYEYYKENIEKYKRIYNKYVDNRVLSLLDEYLAETDKFYAINLDRNNYFTKNIFEGNYLLNKIENLKPAKDDINQIIENMNQVKKLDIVVTGGFHSQTVTDLLEKQNVSYIVITPNVTEGIKLAEDTYYELAKEQSKISFQTIAPVIASLSPQLQKTILKKTDSIETKQIETATNLNDTERAELISELLAAKVLESDDLGEVEIKIQDVIKSIVDDIHKEKVTPALVSRIKNLQEIIKDKKELEKAIDLLQEGTTKQSVTLLRDMFLQLYDALDSFVISATGKLFQQRKYSAEYTEEQMQVSLPGISSKRYYDEAEKQNKEINNNIYDFFYNLNKNKSKVIAKITEMLGDNLDIKKDSFVVEISKHPYYPVDFIKFTITNKTTQKDYKISIVNFGNSGYMEFGIDVEGDSDRKKLVSFTDKLAQNIMEGNFNIEETDVKAKKTETNRKIYYDETIKKNEETNGNIYNFFLAAQIKKSDIEEKIKSSLSDNLDIKEGSFVVTKRSHDFHPMETIKFVVADKTTKKEFEVLMIKFSDPDKVAFGIEVQDNDERVVSFADKLAQAVMDGKFKFELQQETKDEQIGTTRKEYYDETKNENTQVGNNIYSFFSYAQTKGSKITALIRTILGKDANVKEGSLVVDTNNHPYYPLDTIMFTVTDEKTQKEYKISVIKFSNLGDILFSIEIEGDSDRDKLVPFANVLAQEIMKGTYLFGIFEKMNRLQLPSTQESLNKIGNSGIIKKIYKDKSGDNFQFTRLGVAIGTVIESFLLWSPNFIAKHNFNIEDETELYDAVRGIRGAAIAVSLIPAVFSFFNPICAVFIVPTALLTGNILHYIYNTKNSKINVKFSREDSSIAVLIEKDNNRYSLIFDPMYLSIFVGSINADAFSEGTSEYTTPESIEKLLGIKIKISKNKLSVKSNDTRTNIKFAKFGTTENTVKELITKSLPLPKQEYINLLMKDSKCSDVEYVYLSDTFFMNKMKMKDAVDNHKLIVLYPFSKTCDLETLTDEELFSLYLQISTSFFRMLDVLPRYPRLRQKDFIGMEYLLAELIKNAFVHGNLGDLSEPIYVYCTNDSFTVYNSYKAQPISQNKLDFAAMTALSGAHKGLNLMQEYADEGLIQVTPEKERIRQIGDDEKDKFYAVTIKELVDRKEVFDFFLSLFQTKEADKEPNYDNIIQKISDLADNYIKIIYDYCKENEDVLKGRPYFIEKIVDFAVVEKCTEKELKELLSFISELKTEFFSVEKTPRYGYFRKKVENYNISKEFFRYYLKNKDFFNSKEYKELIAYFIFSDGMNLEECLNYESFDNNLKGLIEDLIAKHVYALNVSYSGLALKLFFNPTFNIILKQEYKQKDEPLTNLLRYRTAIKIAHSLYTQLGQKVEFINQDIIGKIVGICIRDIENKRDLLSKKLLISPKTYFHGIDRIKTEFSENFEFRARRDKVSDTGLFVINNNETSDEGEKMFSNGGLKAVFGTLETAPRVHMNLEVEDENNVKEKKDKLLQAIIEYPLLKQKYGLSNAIFAFNGHGMFDAVYFVGREGNDDTRITVTEVAEALLQAYKNGADLEEITLDLTSCFSYYFAENLIKELEEMEIKENLEIKFPQILASSGQETRVGHFVSFTDNETQELAFFTDNMTSAIIEYLQDDDRSGQNTDFLNFDDIFNTEIVASNHTIFISGQDVESVNADFRTNLFELLGDEFIEDEEIDKTIKTTQLQGFSTQEMLDKIGNNKIIKELYKEKSGENFKYTKLGVAIGVLLELFTFWSPNFVKRHNFDPSVQANMTAVVWVIRALSIGLGLAVGVAAVIFLGPAAFVIGIPALFLTEIITHFVWNINKVPKITDLKESIRPVNVEEEVEKTGLAQDFIGMVKRLSADKGFISVYEAYKKGKRKNTVKRALVGDEHITKNNGYALGISTYYLGDGKLFEAVTAMADSETGMNLCTYNNGYYEFEKDGTRLRTNDQYLEKIFDDCIKNNKEIYFFLPPNIYSFNSQDMRRAQQDYMNRYPGLQQILSGLESYQPGITISEIEWIKNHPQYMKYVHFVVGSYTFLDENMRPKIFRKYFNVNNNSKTVATLLSNPKAYMRTGYSLSSQNEIVEDKIDCSKEDKIIVLLIGKEDGTKYSVRFLKKTGVYLTSINDSLCHFSDKNLEDIEKIVGAKIDINENNIVAKSNEPGTTLAFVKDDIFSALEIYSSLKKSPLEISKQQLHEIESLVTYTGSQGQEYIHLDELFEENKDELFEEKKDDPFEENKNKIKSAIENNKLIVIYPFLNYNIDSLTDKQLYALYRTIRENFFLMAVSLFPSDIPGLTKNDVRTMKYILQEFTKNAFVHGNIADPSKPIYVKCSPKGIVVYNAVVEDESIDKEIKIRRKSLATAAKLAGEHKGLEVIQEYEQEGLVEVTPEQERIKTIDKNKYYSIAAVIIPEKQREKTEKDLMIFRDIASSVFSLQRCAYSAQEYKEIIDKILINYKKSAMLSNVFAYNVMDFISEELDMVFFIKPLINQVFGIKDISKILSSKKLLITKTKQQERTLKQVLKDNNIEDTEIVTMEIRKDSVMDIRSDMCIDVQKGIRAKYDSRENKIIVYSKKGIDISNEQVEQLIMEAYFDERNEDIIDNDVVAFANETDNTLDDIINRLKNAYTASVTMPNKETKFNLSSKNISNFTTVCKQEFIATGIKTFVITYEQAEQFTSEIKSLQEQDFKFVISCKADTVADITDFDGLAIDATAITNENEAIKLMETVKKTVFKQGVAKQITIKFGDELYKELSGTDIFNNYGIIPVINADNTNVSDIGKYEVENVKENNIDNLLRNNNVIGLVIDNARVFLGKRSILKEIFSKEHKYNKGYNASLSSKFDYVCYDVTKLKDILAVDIDNEEQLERLKDIDLSSLSLSSDSLTYLEYLNKKGNYEEMVGFVRGVAMNSARAQIIKGLKDKEIELDIEKFAKEANGKYQKAFLTAAVQLIMENVDITALLETDFIDSDMTTKQYLDSVYEKVNVNIEDILKNNEHKIRQTQNAEKTIEEFKNFVILLDNLKIVKEATADFEMSMKAVKDILSAA